MDMRQILNIMEGVMPIVLDEAAIDRYMQMFNSIDDKSGVTEEIKFAQSVLKREDRISWFLRWARINLVMLKIAKSKDEERTKLEALLDKYVRELASKTNLTPNDVKTQAKLSDSSGWKRELQHFASMFSSVAQMDSMRFGFETPTQILEKLKELEDKHVVSNDRKLKATEEDAGAKKVIDFGDGFAWWLLDRESCDLEAKAMGHCGNTATPRPGDRILTLRRRDANYDVPFLTFILRADGFLGEMKGRANNKPDAKYHKYIVPLLKNDIVKGIRGGGYAAGNNFSLDDLPEIQREDVLSVKPDIEISLSTKMKVVGDYFNSIFEKRNGGGGHGDIVVYKDYVGDVNATTEFYNIVQLYDKIKYYDKNFMDVSSLYEALKLLRVEDLKKLSVLVDFDLSETYDDKDLGKLSVAILNDASGKEFIKKIVKNDDLNFSLEYLNEFAKKYINRLIPTTGSFEYNPEIDLEGDLDAGMVIVTITKSELDAMYDEIHDAQNTENNDNNDENDFDDEEEEYGFDDEEDRSAVSVLKDRGWFEEDGQFDAYQLDDLTEEEKKILRVISFNSHDFYYFLNTEPKKLAKDITKVLTKGFDRA